MHLLGEFARLAEIRFRRLPPEEIRIRRVARSARDGMLHRMAVSLLQAEEALRRALAAIDPWMVALVDIAGDEGRRMRVGASQKKGRHAADVRRETRRVEGADEGLRRHEHLAAEMAAFLLGGELILEMHAGRSGLDHRLHQLERVERPAEAGFGIRHDGRVPIDGMIALGFGDLVGATQGVVDAPHDVGNRGGRIERLVRIHLAGIVGVGRDLPAGKIDGLETGLHLLQGLIAGERAERAHEGPFAQELPQAARRPRRAKVYSMRTLPESRSTSLAS